MADQPLERRKVPDGMAAAVKSIAEAAQVTAQTAADSTSKLVGRVDNLDMNVSTMQKRQQEFGEQLKTNTDATMQVEKNTAELIQVWGSFKGGLAVLGWLGVAAKWVAIIAGCITAVGGAFYALTHWGADITPK